MPYYNAGRVRRVIGRSEAIMALGYEITLPNAPFEDEIVFPEGVTGPTEDEIQAKRKELQEAFNLENPDNVLGD